MPFEKQLNIQEFLDSRSFGPFHWKILGGLKSEVQHLSRIRCCNARQNYFIPAPST